MGSEHRDIQIRILEEDGITYPADALVLKYAQALYGLDARVVQRTGVSRASLPKPGAVRSISDPSGITARGLVFIGAPSARAYTYSDVRHFGYEALRSVAQAFPEAAEVALTLHGVGFGLDEIECFDSEVGGILGAIESGDLPRSLQTVSFLEFDRSRAERLRKRLEFLLGSRSTIASGMRHEAKSDPPQVDRLRAVATQGVQPHAFVAMPFDKSLSDRFHYGIYAAIRDNGLLVERIDQQAFTGDVVQRLKDQIRTAKVVVADVTGNNANVLLEVGFAWGSGVPTILVSHQDSQLAFDVQSQKCLLFDQIRDLELKLKSELQRLLPTL